MNQGPICQSGLRIDLEIRGLDAELKGAYQELGVIGAWQLKGYPVAHLETAEMRQEVLDFLDATFLHG